MTHLRLILVLLLCSAFAAGQSIMTTVTGTVVDPVGTPYSGGRYNLDLVNNTGVVAANVRIGTSSVYPTTISGVLTSTGAFPAAGVPLYDNGQISPAGTQWRFSICNSGGTICFTTNLTVTGASQNVGSALSAASVLLNTGSGGSVVTGPLGQLLDLSTTNDGVTGTTALGLAIRSGSTAICATTADTATPAYPVSNAVTVNGTTVAQAGTTGNAPLILQGRASVTFDANGVTKGDYVGVSTVSGCKAMSLGVSYPAGRCWVGIALETVVGSAAGVIAVNNSCSLAPSGYSVAQSAGVAQPARTKLNFIGGLSAADNAGNTSTDVNISSLPFATGSAVAPSLYATSFPLGFGFYGSATEWVGEYNHAAILHLGQGGMSLASGTSCVTFATDNTFVTVSGGLSGDGLGNIYVNSGATCTNGATGRLKAAHLAHTSGEQYQYGLNASQAETFQSQTFGGTTATGGTAGNTATTVFTWTTAFPDANYHVICSPEGAVTGSPIFQGVIAKDVGGQQFTVQVMAATNAASSFAAMRCRGEE